MASVHTSAAPAPSPSPSPSPSLSPSSSRPAAPRSTSTPARRAADLPLDERHLASPEASSFDVVGAQVMRRRPRRGMTIDEAQSQHIISDRERSIEFEGMPLTDKEMRKLPRKLRSYYKNCALLQEHYAEVDALLSGELPSTIASSFHPPPRPTRAKSYTRPHGDLVEDGDRDSSGDERPGWSRRQSLWKVKRNGVANSNEHEEAGEDTPLLDAAEKEERRERIAKVALNVNTLVNVLLVAAKAIAVYFSASISLTASLVDSSLDLLSTFIILGTSWAIGIQSDKHLYPAGKRRFEPLGVLIFSVAMIASFIQVFIESFQRALAASSAEEAVELSAIGMGTMLATIGVKAVIWVWCSRIPSSGVQALAQDAENDVFFNIMSLAFPFIGTKLHMPLLDPIGGMVLSTYIIVEWIKTLGANFANLSGKSASTDQISRVLYLVSRFNPVLEVADVECYHIGDDLIVEVDVILPEGSTLHFAHDVGETIQCMLESLDGVLRAYVHADYSSNNPSQHTTRAVRSGPTPQTSRETVKTPTSASVTPTLARPNGSQDLVVSPGAI
ncbi:hypothetical protein Q5752_004425 [Cryptotrichosporon argae]